MPCSGCSSGRGCGSGGSCSSVSGGCNKLNVFNWLANMELPFGQRPFDIVEVRFKNSRKEFYRNRNGLQLMTGSVVIVESPTQGYDAGVVSLSGELVRLQMKKKGVGTESEAIKNVLRAASNADIEKWKEAQALEKNTLVRARILASSLKLDMKINDIEYQADKTQVSFYYTSPGRVDFRELIKACASEFRVRIQMWQIGERQEAGRLGGIGSCGRELCCSTWLTDFRAVNTQAARYQQLALNPVKLAGQCGKLKCCLNYELDTYMDALKDFPKTIDIETQKGKAVHQKTDIFKRIIWYSYTDAMEVFIPLSTDRVKQLIELNRQGKKADELSDVKKEEVKEIGYVVGKHQSRPKHHRHNRQKRAKS